MTIVADQVYRPLSRQEFAQAAAAGSGTVTRSIRVTRPGKDASINAMLDGQAEPPTWLASVVQDEFPSRDDRSVIRPGALIRFAQACAALPPDTPRPYVNVGDDETLGAEWDIGVCHVAIQVGNDPTVDTIYLEVDEQEIGEISLGGNVGLLKAIMAQIVAR